MSFERLPWDGERRADRRPSGAEHTRHSRKLIHGRTTLRVTASVLVFLLTFGAAAMTFGYARLQGNINQANIDDLLGGDRPEPPPADPAAGRDQNILVIGSDSRSGDNVEIDGSGTSEGMRSDTTMLVNIPASRQWVNVVSIPRDTLVEIPSCRLPDGSMTKAQPEAMFNSAFSIGGQTGDIGAAAACTIKTVEALTGIYIDDFVVVDFAGFISVVDALGGIAMYFPEDINDRASGLNVEAGCRLLDGTDALALARVRKIGDGSDISRIGRQQEIVMEILSEALSSSLLSDPIRLYKVLDVSTQTLTTSPFIGSIPNLIGLAGSLASIKTDDLMMVTMPFDWAGARVVENTDFSPYVWEALLQGERLDPRVSGASTDIVAAEIPAWDDLFGFDALPGDEPLTDPGTDSTVGPTAGPGETASPTPSPEPTPIDPAASCTKATAS